MNDPRTVGDWIAWLWFPAGYALGIFYILMLQKSGDRSGDLTWPWWPFRKPKRGRGERKP